jgi:hypothetical protein
MKMNKTNIPESDLDIILKQTLKDDLPPEAEARMSRQFLKLKRALDQTETLAEPDRWLWLRGAFRNEVLALASAVMLIAGGVMHLSGNQSVLANSIERLKTVVTISAALYRATSMDCTVLKPGVEGKDLSYRVRWLTTGVSRVDMNPTGGERQTLWISKTTMPPDPIWQPALEFLTPMILAQHMEQQYALTQAGSRDGAGADEFLLVGQENQQVVEIAIDARTYLPKTLKKYLPDSARTGEKRECLMEDRFQWNQPIAQELLAPESLAGRSQVNH